MLMNIKINAKLHQTYINYMTNTNTHKMQCIDKIDKKRLVMAHIG